MAASDINCGFKKIAFIFVSCYMSSFAPLSNYVWLCDDVWRLCAEYASHVQHIPLALCLDFAEEYSVSHILSDN